MQNRPIIVSSSFGDFDGLRDQLKGVEMEMIPLRSGPFSGHTDALIGEDFIFTSGKFNSDHRYRGTSHSSQVLLGIHFGPGGTANYGSNAAEEGDLSVLQPGMEHFGSMGGTFEYAALSIEAEELVRLGLADGVAGRSGLVMRNDHIRAPADIAALACRTLANLAKLAFAPASTTSAARIELLKRSILYPYLLVAAHGESEPDGLASEPHTAIVRQAEEWLDGRPPEKLHVIDLCLALSVSLRTLQRAFHEVLGMGPAHYLMHYRLHKVRKALVSCDPARTRVTDAALDHGFWELGRFAGLYRSTYGERPSDTLRRRSMVAKEI